MATIQITALRHSAFYTPLLMAIAGGYLKDEGLEPVYRPATPERPVPESLRNGDAHVAQSAVATSFASLERGEVPDIVHFAQINALDGFFIAGRQPEPDFCWADLKGKRVLVDHFFQPLAMLRYGLHRQGVSLDELNVIDAGDVAAIEQAFRDGEGDYVHMQGPMPQQLQHEGLACVVASVGEAVGPVAFSSLCATRNWLETDMARAFMRAYCKALRYSIEAPATEVAAKEQAAGFFRDIDHSVLADTIAAYQKLGNWRDDPVIGEAEYENLLDVFSYSGLITERHAYGQVIVLPPA